MDFLRAAVLLHAIWQEPVGIANPPLVPHVGFGACAAQGCNTARTLPSCVPRNRAT